MPNKNCEEKDMPKIVSKIGLHKKLFQDFFYFSQILTENWFYNNQSIFRQAY